MNACIIFDVSAKQEEVIRKLLPQGYWRSWLNATTSKVYNLPSNSVWKPNIALSEAKIDLSKTLAELNKLPENISNPITIKRCIILPVNPWEAFEGEPNL